MKRWWLWIALLLSLGVNVGVVGTILVHRAAGRAEPLPRPAAGTAQPPQLSALADRLRLSGPARDRFLAVQHEFFSEVMARRTELATLDHELRRELTAPRPDRQRIDRILERRGRAHSAIETAFTDNVLACREILGPRQQRQFFRFLGRLRQAGPGARP